MKLEPGSNLGPRHEKAGCLGPDPDSQLLLYLLLTLRDGTGPWALVPSLPLLALEQRLGLGGELPLGDGQLLFRIHAEALIATLRAVDLNTAALGDNQGR